MSSIPLPELPVILNASTSGIKLLSNATKSLPAITDVGTLGASQSQENELRNAAIRQAFALTKAANRRSKQIARIKNKRAQKRSELHGAIGYGARRSNYNKARKRAAAWRARPDAYRYLV